ncbi:xanthine dehydrogenase family protein molybdopterin-binding subunit [Aquimarina brevivitae]|uniref:Isoquinoline 1-oxidoreductase beta subunit n=1 Tax=Aquimarina brevivitae TaxID=323412 RepID=A0A4Q7NUS3_9FLAO|nr:molybdopterin cofactor-binding domain-containing protein [Aquimarina brevivitae]RZS90690.1 isoquinoline 1-oxidoreductase beta subunit [Aquimarina brevivitae]
MKSSNNIHLSRRSFIKTSALAGGGMLIGFNLFQACKPEAKPPVDISQLNFNDFNAFIKIADNGMVTIFSPNPEIGQGVKTSMPMLIAEELDISWDNVRVVQGALDTENYTRQVAGGSQSIRLGWEPLRQTGATARQMLINAAAQRWNVDPKNCTTEAGVVKGPDGATLGYGELVKDAAVLEVPEEVTLKKPEDFTIIGKDIVNVDVDKIVTGKPLFGLDYKEDGMLTAVVMRAPSFGLKLKDYDASESKNVTGVVDIIDVKNRIAVLAKDTWTAMKARDLIKANWEEDTEIESTAMHDKKLMDLLNGKDFKTMRADGNVKKAFAEADQVLERVYESPFLPHNCMEPMNFFADVQDEKVRLVGPIQTPERTAQQVATLLERDVKDVSVEMTRMGGGFGRRLYGDFAQEAALISNIVKKPVKVVYTREDDMTAGVYRPAIKYKISASIKDGEITGYHLKEASINSNMYGLIPNFFPAGAIENYQVDVAKYDSNITTGAWRAPYTNFLSFAEQSFFDELAEVLGKDNIALRLELLEKVKGTTDERIQYSPERLQNVIREAVAKSGYGQPKEGVYQGFSSYYCHNTHVAEVADVVMENEVPVVKKVTCVVDCGVVVNPLGAKNQIEGGVLDGIGHAMYGNFTFEKGTPVDKNFNTYHLIRINETPQVETHFIKNDYAPTGLGEPALPPAGAAVANAIKIATGKRLYKQPFVNELKVKAPLG